MDAAKTARSSAIYPALMLALNTGERDAEIRGLQWERVDLAKAVLTVGTSKTEAGEGRTVSLNSALLGVMIEYAKWYTKRFGTIQPKWVVSPSAKGLTIPPGRWSPSKRHGATFAGMPASVGDGTIIGTR